MDSNSKIQCKGHEQHEQTVIDFFNSKLNLLKENEKLNHSNLFDNLKSGVLLCRLINLFKPDAIVINYSENPFKQRENISNFLKHSRILFSNLSNETFETEDLFEKKNLNQVINTLLFISKYEIPTSSLKSPALDLKKGFLQEKEKILTYMKSKEKLTLVNEMTDEVLAQYLMGPVIGRGNFGTVYKAIDIKRGNLVAIKRIPLINHNESVVQDLRKEVELLKNLKQKHIIDYYGYNLTANNFDIILEYMENGSLLHLMKNFFSKNFFSESLVLMYVKQILIGLEYLHFKKVVHCDLKAANILTTKTGTIKLTDFGVSKQLSMIDKESLSNVAGTPNWMAPEIIQLEKITTKSDIWSLGAVIIELLTGLPPFGTFNPLTSMFKIVKEDIPLPSAISEELADFLKLCFQKNPNDRPTATQLLNHKWIKKDCENTSLCTLETEELELEESDEELCLSSLNSHASYFGENREFISPYTNRRANCRKRSISQPRNSISSSSTSSLTVQRERYKSFDLPRVSEEAVKIYEGKASFDSAIGTLGRDSTIYVNNDECNSEEEERLLNLYNKFKLKKVPQKKKKDFFFVEAFSKKSADEHNLPKSIKDKEIPLNEVKFNKRAFQKGSSKSNGNNLTKSKRDLFKSTSEPTLHQFSENVNNHGVEERAGDNDTINRGRKNRYSKLWRDEGKKTEPSIEDKHLKSVEKGKKVKNRHSQDCIIS
ncbi:hypothetical protein HDU92_003080 [Lobulomyces angularis]|nr:hypothetical protein HDU92_003080 [Lobulomyces angularis]